MFTTIDYSGLPLQAASHEAILENYDLCQETIKMNVLKPKELAFWTSVHPNLLDNNAAYMEIKCTCGQAYIFKKPEDVPSVDLFCDHCMQHLLEFWNKQERTIKIIEAEKEAEGIQAFWVKLFLTDEINLNLELLAKATRLPLDKLMQLVQVEVDLINNPSLLEEGEESLDKETQDKLIKLHQELKNILNQ